MYYTLGPPRIRTIITLQQLIAVQISAPPWLPVFVHRILTLLPRCCVYEATSGASSWAPASSSPLTNRIHIIIKPWFKEQTPIARNCSSHHRAPAVLLRLESVRSGGKKMNIETAANCFNPASNPLTPQTDQYSIFCAMANTVPYFKVGEIWLNPPWTTSKSGLWNMFSRLQLTAKQTYFTLSAIDDYECCNKILFSVV